MATKSPAVVYPAVFRFESSEVRTVIVNEDVWFMAKDIATALGYAKPEGAISNHCKHAKSLTSLDSGSQVSVPGNTLFIPERDVYRLVMKSTLPAAEKFEDWVVSEVLPSIRKHGHYTPVPAVHPNLPTTPMEILKLTFDALQQVSTRVDQIEDLSLNTATRLDDFENNRSLESWQAYNVKAELTGKVYEFHEKYGINRAMLFSASWGFIKRHFHVPTYTAIPAKRYDEALMVVKGLSLEQLPPAIMELARGAKRATTKSTPAPARQMAIGGAL